MTIFHRNIDGQPNTSFSHRDDWAGYCTFCTAVCLHKVGIVWCLDCDGAERVTGRCSCY